MNIYEDHKLHNKELPFIFNKHTLHADDRSFDISNWHENVELICFTKGRGAVYDNARRFPLEAGKLFAISANALHSLAAEGGDIEYCYLIVDRSFCLENGFDSSLLGFDCVIENERIRELMLRLREDYSLKEQLPFFTLRIRAAVLAIMTELCLHHSIPVSAEEKPKRSTLCIKKAITFIEGAYDRDLSLDELAEFVGLDKFYLSHEFRKYTGQSFITYLNRFRCKIAAKLLAESKWSISRIAERCGFRNRSYFAKCFKKTIGLTPNEFRQYNVFGR